MARREIEPYEVERGLVALAAANGNSALASRTLKADGISIKDETLRRWGKKMHLERYEQIRAKVLPQIQAEAAEDHREMASRLGEVNRELLTRMQDKVDEIPARDLPGAVRNVSTSRGIEVDKAQLLGGQPTQRVEGDIGQILRKLQGRGLTFVGSEAEVVDAEVVED